MAKFHKHNRKQKKAYIQELICYNSIEREFRNSLWVMCLGGRSIKKIDEGLINVMVTLKKEEEDNFGNGMFYKYWQ